MRTEKRRDPVQFDTVPERYEPKQVQRAIESAARSVLDAVPASVEPEPVKQVEAGFNWLEWAL